MKNIILTLSLISIASPSFAQTNMAGIGATNCSEIQQHLSNKQYRSALLSWTTGFYTGINMALITTGQNSRNLSGITENTIIENIASFCSKNPQKPIIAATENMYGRLPAN